MVLSAITGKKRSQILGAARKYGAHDLRVFGSVARGDANNRSDVDILIKLDASNLQGLQYFGVLEQFREEVEAILGSGVDIVDELGLQDPLPDHVLKEAVAL
jgi:predicted nucleotidyltransferase